MFDQLSISERKRVVPDPEMDRFSVSKYIDGAANAIFIYISVLSVDSVMR